MSTNRGEIIIEGRGKEELLVLLKEAQAQLGYLSEEFLVDVAKSLGLSVSEVYGTATFYSFLSIKPLGKNMIRVCQSIPCFLSSGHIIIDSIKKELGIKPGETTPDGRFSLEWTNCIGACDKAPAMMINHDVYGDLTPAKISQILKEYS